MTFGKRVDGPGGRRRAKRSPLSLRAYVTTTTGSFEARIIEMSDTGAKVHGATIPGPGQSVLVRVGSLEAYGTVAWSNRQLFGIDFRVPTDANEQLALFEMMRLFDPSPAAE